MDYIRQLGPVVLDHRFRRITESLLRSAEEIYQARGLPFRGRWVSTYTLLYNEGALAIGQIADRLKLTHPGVIGITDEMASADVISALRDPGDARRRLLEVTPHGRTMGGELFALWKELGEAQRRRFAEAKCDIMTVLDKVEDELDRRPLSAEVLMKIQPRSKATPKTSAVRRIRSAALGLLVAAPIALVDADIARAQAIPASPTEQSISAATRSAVVNALSDSLINGYIYAATGRTLADTLRAELKSGVYDKSNTRDAFATRINETLRRISNDRHLGVQYLRPASAGGPVRVRRVPGAAVPSGDSGRRLVRVPADSATRAAFDSAASRRPAGISRIISAPDYGFAFAQVLDGNIGYLDLPGFSGDPTALVLTDSVMALFAGTGAIIIDVGRNRGGGPQVIQRLSAYLFDKPMHLVSSFMRGMEKPMERWTTDSVPGKRLPKTPVYVLTSRSTISASESFTFGLRNHGRITVVGERTAGGGHFGDFVPLTEGFSVFLPRGRTYNPATNEGWEAEGLKPDVEVPYEKALETALGLARMNGKR